MTDISFSEGSSYQLYSTIQKPTYPFSLISTTQGQTSTHHSTIHQGSTFVSYSTNSFSSSTTFTSQALFSVQNSVEIPISTTKGSTYGPHAYYHKTTKFSTTTLIPSVYQSFKGLSTTTESSTNFSSPKEGLSSIKTTNDHNISSFSIKGSTFGHYSEKKERPTVPYSTSKFNQHLTRGKSTFVPFSTSKHWTTLRASRSQPFSSTLVSSKGSSNFLTQKGQTLVSYSTNLTGTG